MNHTNPDNFALAKYFFEVIVVGGVSAYKKIIGGKFSCLLICTISNYIFVTVADFWLD